MGLNPSIYIIGDKGLLSLHYLGHTRPSYLCKRLDIQPRVSLILESYNH